MRLTKKGFSLVELMIVVAIIGILVAALLPQLQGMILNARVSNAKQSLKALSDAIVRFNAVEPRECEKLQWLVPNYMQEIKRDPWGSMYSLSPEDGVIISFGPDKKPGDLTNPNSIERRDNIEFYYKAKLGISQAKVSLDIDGNGKLNNGDRITIFFTRVAETTSGYETADFIFCNIFEEDSTNERWLYDNAPTGAGATPPLMFNDFSYVTNLTVPNGAFNHTSAFTTQGSFGFFPLDSSGVAGLGNGYTLLGGANINQDDTYVTFEISADPNWELDAELFVRFSPGSTAPQVGKYKDSRGNTAIQNGYNVKVETYF